MFGYTVVLDIRRTQSLTSRTLVRHNHCCPRYMSDKITSVPITSHAQSLVSWLRSVGVLRLGSCYMPDIIIDVKLHVLHQNWFPG
ncbi:hypothetical protein CDAR_587731 [Caerostris darwini]|uniref:Uncharacterized protein n=1 Tax=Caerostris darwini TaxID=1538125 RepID=A0AAV4SLY1_9ARAC|nr:hypothetical protein CDAR_587731 [Caerostris darwini]